MYSKSNWPKPEKPRVQTVGKRGKDYAGPYDHGMGQDPIVGNGQEVDPTRYTGYRRAIPDPPADVWTLQNVSGVSAETEPRGMRQRGRKP